MMKTKIIRSGLGFVFLVSPSVISLVAVLNQSVLLAVISVIGIYLSVAILPCTRRHENIWVFFLSMFASIPFNIKLIDVLMRVSFIENDFMLLQIMRCTLIYVVLFCVEEIILAAIARFIWKKQKAILL